MSAGAAQRFVVGVVVHPTRPVDDSLATIARWAGAQGADVVVRSADASRTTALGDVAAVVDDAGLAAAVDGVVSLGGDGTMLGALRLVSTRPVPVLGVNHGRLGFLVEVSPAGLGEALERLSSGQFTVEPHRALVGTVHAADGADGADGVTARLEPAVAFNDVVLTRRGRPGGVTVDLEVDGSDYGYYRCDALVLATPTGSTAYSHAAGGPVVSPSAAATVVTPVAPMSGISRSVVLGAQDEVVLRPGSDHGRAAEPVDVEVDGIPAGTLEPGTSLTVRSVADAGSVVRLESGAHARRSRVRLSLLDLPLRPDQLLELVPPELRRGLGGMDLSPQDPPG